MTTRSFLACVLALGACGGSSSSCPPGDVCTSISDAAQGDDAAPSSSKDGGTDAAMPPGDMAMSPYAADPQNCGAPGHSCLGGTCSNGLCKPFAYYATDGYTPIAIDDTNIYMYGPATSGQPSYNAVVSCPKSGCTTPTIIADQQQDVGPVAYVTNTEIFWMVEGDVPSISKCTKTGCTAPTVLAGGNGNSEPFSLIGDATNVYWTDVGAGKVFACAQSGCNQTPTVIWDAMSMDCNGFGQLCEYPSYLTADDTTLYWSINRGDSGVTAARPAIMSCPKTGCPTAGPTVLASFVDMPNNIAFNEGYLYFGPYVVGTQSWNFVRCPATGCATTPETIFSEPFNDLPGPVSTDPTTILFDDTHVIVSNFSLGECPLGGCMGQPTLVSEYTLGQVSDNTHVTADATAYYFTEWNPPADNTTVVMKLAR